MPRKFPGRAPGSAFGGCCGMSLPPIDHADFALGPCAAILREGFAEWNAYEWLPSATQVISRRLDERASTQLREPVLRRGFHRPLRMLGQQQALGNELGCRCTYGLHVGPCIAITLLQRRARIPRGVTLRARGHESLQGGSWTGRLRTPVRRVQPHKHGALGRQQGKDVRIGRLERVGPAVRGAPTHQRGEVRVVSQTDGMANFVRDDIPGDVRQAQWRNGCWTDANAALLPRIERPSVGDEGSIAQADA